jgi:HlyD family secretion protein
MTGYRHRTGALLLALLAAACKRSPREVVGTGTVEYLQTDVAPDVAGRVTRMLVDEGATVRAGDTLATLASTTLPSDLREREAQLAQATADLRDLERGARPEEIAHAESELRAASADAERAAKDLERGRPLAASGSMSAQQFDALGAAAAQTAARREAARESLRLLQAGARVDQLRSARARVEAATAALESARRSDGELTIVAPITGTVLTRYAEVGELVAAQQPVLTLGDPTRPWVRIYVNQRDVPRIALGSGAVAVLDGMPELPIRGRVASIATKAEYTPRVALTEEERADMLFGVKIEFGADAGGAGALRPGLPVTVRLTDAGAPVRLAARGTP